MVGAEQAVQIDRTQFELAAIRDLESRNSARLLALVWLSGRELEEGVVHEPNRSCDATGWESLQPKDSQALSRLGPRSGRPGNAVDKEAGEARRTLALA
jgi:hypothetical protein